MADAAPEPGPIGRLAARLNPGRRADLLAVVVFLLISGYVFSHLLTSVTGHIIRVQSPDQTLFEWFFAATAHAVSHGHNPFNVQLANAPLSINGMANTSVYGLAVPLIPVTLLAGPQWSFVLAMVLGTAATAGAWYWLFSRQLTDSRLGAAVAGALCAYGPAMISQANGHMQMVIHFPIPIILGLVLRLREPGRLLRRSLAIGFFAVWQAFIGEEILLVAVLGFGVFLLALLVQRRELVRAHWRRTLGGLIPGGVLAAIALAYPLWYQFNGAQHYDGLLFSGQYINDLLSFTGYARRSLGGLTSVTSYSANPTEDNAFFGWSLIALGGLLLVWLWRSAVVRAAAATAVLFALLSMGDEIYVKHRDTGIPGPHALISNLPLTHDILPSRLAFVVLPMLGALIALGFAAARDADPAPALAAFSVRRLWLGAVVLALLPLFPLPLQAVDRNPVPQFFTSGTYSGYIHPGEVVVAIPVTRGPEATEAMDWQVAAHMNFRIVGGYFVGPQGADGHGDFDAVPRPTDRLLHSVAFDGARPQVTDAVRAQFRADVAYWGADVFVLDSSRANADVVTAVMTELAGPPQRVQDVLLWPAHS